MSSIFFDPQFDFDLPHCPVDISQKTLRSPSTFFMETIVSATAIIFAIITILLYNNVEIPVQTSRSKKIKIASKNISNRMWFLYFACVSMCTALNSIRFSIPRSISDDGKESKQDAEFTFIMTLSSMIAHGFSSLFLFLALNYQRKFRGPKYSQCFSNILFKFLNGTNIIALWANRSSLSQVAHNIDNRTGAKNVRANLHESIIHDDDIVVGEENIGRGDPGSDSSVGEDEEPSFHYKSFSASSNNSRQYGTNNRSNRRMSFPQRPLFIGGDLNRAVVSSYQYSMQEDDRSTAKKELTIAESYRFGWYRLIRFLCSLEFLMVSLLLLFFATTYLRACNLGDMAKIYSYIQLGAIVLQRIPIIFLVFVISITRRKRISMKNARDSTNPKNSMRNHDVIDENYDDDVENNEENDTDNDGDNHAQHCDTDDETYDTNCKYDGPNYLAKVFLVTAAVLNLPNDIPLSYWHTLLSSSIHIMQYQNGCLFYVASLYDVVIFLYWLSLFFWFLFMRQEYKRKQEEIYFDAIQMTTNSAFENKTII